MTTSLTQETSLTYNVFNQYPQIFVNRLDKENFGNFTQVFNHIIDGKISEEKNLPKLRPTASRLLENIIAKKDGWSFSIADMSKRVCVGKDAINTARKELIEKGYLKIIRYIDKLTGRILGSKYFASECAEFLNENKSLVEKKTIYHLEKVNAEIFIKSESLPCSGNPTMDKPNLAKPTMEKPYTINTYSTNTSLINNSSISSEEKENNLSTENLTQDEILNDDDFLKKFDNKTTNIISTDLESKKDLEVITPKDDLDSTNEAKMKTHSKPNNNLTNEIDSVGIGEEKIIPQGVGADCGQNVDKENLYKRILAVGVYDQQAKDLIETVNHEILEQYLKAVPYWKQAGKINNIGAFYNTSVRNPKPEQLPKELLIEKKQEQKKKEKNKLQDFCKYLGLSEDLGMREIKAYISSCKNIFMNKDDLASKTFERNFNSLIDAIGPTEAEKIANQSVRKALNSINTNRNLLEKTLDYLKINTEIDKFNYQNLINKALNKLELQFAGTL